MKVGILVAMAAECRSLTPRRVPSGGCLALDDNCVVGLSGAGPVAAKRTTAALADAGAGAIISWGCAAALASELKPGDLVLPTQIVCEDGTPLDTAETWRQELSSILAERMVVYSGLLAERGHIVASEKEKRTIFNTTGAIALDMESAAAARAAKSLDLPFLAVRSIVDPVDVTIPPSIAASFDKNGILNVPKMLARSLLNPIDFLGVIRLGKHFSAAMDTLRLTASIARESNFAAR